MKGSRNGIVAAGNWILDQVKIVEQYPKEDGITNIIAQSTNNGGSPYNVLKDLAKMGASFKLAGVGLVGNDENGQKILDDCIKNGIDKKAIKSTDLARTSFTDVMTVSSTGRRTFFHQRGANALLDVSHFRLEKFKSKFFHLGYQLLLDKLDKIDENGRTGSSYLLEKAQNMGMKTSTDVVSESSDRFKVIVPASLPYVNFLFLNDYDASKITGLTLQNGGNFSLEALEKAALKLFEMGVNDLVSIHFKEGIFLMDNEGKKYMHGKAKIPSEEVEGAAGAADAISAGLLWALHEDMSLDEGIRLAATAAGCCMLDASCSKGILPFEETLKVGARWGFYNV